MGCNKIYSHWYNVAGLSSRNDYSFFAFTFLTTHGNVSPCPIRVNNTTATDMNIMALRWGNGLPSSRVLGNPIAMASETIPRIPDQLIIKLFLESSRACSLTFLLFLPLF